MDLISMSLLLSGVLMGLVVGVQLYRGKWLFLIAGYNTMNKEKKSKVNGAFLGKVVGVIVLLSSLIILLMFIYPAGQTLFLVLQILVVTAGLIYVNTSKKVKSE